MTDHKSKYVDGQAVIPGSEGAWFFGMIAFAALFVWLFSS